MGLSPSGDIFNIGTQMMIEGVGGVHKSIDDVLVEARSKRDMYESCAKSFPTAGGMASLCIQTNLNWGHVLNLEVFCLTVLTIL